MTDYYQKYKKYKSMYFQLSGNNDNAIFYFPCGIPGSFEVDPTSTVSPGTFEVDPTSTVSMNLDVGESKIPFNKIQHVKRFISQRLKHPYENINITYCDDNNINDNNLSIIIDDNDVIQKNQKYYIQMFMFPINEYQNIHQNKSFGLLRMIGPNEPYLKLQDIGVEKTIDFSKDKFVTYNLEIGKYYINSNDVEMSLGTYLDQSKGVGGPIVGFLKYLTIAHKDNMINITQDYANVFGENARSLIYFEPYFLFKYTKCIKFLNKHIYGNRVPQLEWVNTENGLDTSVKRKDNILQYGQFGKLMDPPNNIEYNFIGRVQVPVLKVNIVESKGVPLTDAYDTIIEQDIRARNVYSSLVSHCNVCDLSLKKNTKKRKRNKS